MASTAMVEFTFKYDDNTPPPTLMVERATERCESCGRFHHTYITGGDFIQDDRPFESMGWVVAPDTVLIRDPGVSARFIESAAVALPNGGKIAAAPLAILARAPWMLVKTETPIPGAVPLAFQDAEPPPSAGVLANVSKVNTEWRVGFEKAGLGGALPAWGERRGLFYETEQDGLFLGDDGASPGFVFGGAGWDPEKPFSRPPFEVLSMDGLAAADARVDALRGNGIHLATLHFRSPRKRAGREDDAPWSGDDDAESAVQYAAALHLAPGRFLVPWGFKPGQMTRLERVTLRGADGHEEPAEFAASLENFQAFVVEAPGLASAPLEVREGDARGLADGAPLLLATVTADSGGLEFRHDRTRAEDAEESRGGHFAVEFANGQEALAFDADGRLATLPIARLVKHEGDDPPANFGAAALAALVAELPAGEVDAANAPLPARDENRVAWLGVELQALNAGLARELNVAHLTRAGENWRGEAEHTGAVVAFVYPGSPAERAGIRGGDVLLWFTVEGRPMIPYPLGGAEDDGRGEFPWRMYDQIPVEDFEDAPTPWPPVFSPGNQLFTIAALGREIRVAAVSEGVERAFHMTVELAPDTYESAPQFEAEALGLDARDITFEVRRYFKREADDPGVIVSRVEPGSHAAVAGIKPYEMILKVNDAEVRNVAEFEAQLKDAELLRLTVRRMNRDRIVRVNLAEEAKPEGGGLLNTLRGMLR